MKELFTTIAGVPIWLRRGDELREYGWDKDPLPSYVAAAESLWEQWRNEKATEEKEAVCPLCKPHKTGGENRWKPKERDALDRAERESRNA